MAKRGLFDKPPTIDVTAPGIEDYVSGKSGQIGTYSPRQHGWMTILGRALSGGTAPFLGNMDWAVEQQKMQMLQDQNDMEFQKYLMANSANSQSGGGFIVDPITGEASPISFPAGVVPNKDTKLFKGVISPEQMIDRASAQGEAKMIQKNIETSDKLAGAVKKLAILNKQYNEALPSGDRTPIEQRFAGGAESWAAKKGLVNNPKLVALKKNARPIAINLIRLFGEVGNLSEIEQQGALEVASLEGLTEEERFQQVRQFAEYALAGASPEAIKMIKGRKDLSGILDAFNIELGEESNDQDIKNNKSNIKDLKSKYGLK